MERRVLLATSLSFALLFLYQPFVPPPPEQAAAVTAPAAPGVAPAAGAPLLAPAAAAPAVMPTVAATRSDSVEREFVVDVAICSAAPLQPEGGVVISTPPGTEEATELLALVPGTPMLLSDTIVNIAANIGTTFAIPPYASMSRVWRRS